MAPPDSMEDVELGPPKTGASTINRAQSALDRSTDPFAEREGKTLVWRNVNMKLVSGASF